VGATCMRVISMVLPNGSPRCAWLIARASQQRRGHGEHTFVRCLTPQQRQHCAPSSSSSSSSLSSALNQRRYGSNSSDTSCTVDGSAAEASPAMVRALLGYQGPVREGAKLGRYVAPDEEAKAALRAKHGGRELDDVLEFQEVDVHNARVALVPQATLETRGFELRAGSASAVTDFSDDEEVRRVYYPEMEALVRAAMPSVTRVIVFDHTVRDSGATKLNTLGKEGAVAATVPRVHCDYTPASALQRLKSLAKQGSYTGRTLSEEEQRALASNRFTFINIWRSINSEPVQSKPLAVCDPASVPDKDVLEYDMYYEDRIGQSYSLKHSDRHKWYYFPKMTKNECLMFKVFDSKGDGPRFVPHTAFDDPSEPDNAPPRRSIECRVIACHAPAKKVKFFDMIHSNNAARIRLWLRLKGFVGSDAPVDTHFVTYPELQAEEFVAVNPLRKVPALVFEDGNATYESQVILNYLEDKFRGVGLAPSFDLGTAEERAFVNLLCRIHDLYIASPNSTQVGFSHTQGAMYLAPYETKWCAAFRVMDRPTRAAKLAEIWKQLKWLEGQCRGNFLAGAAVTHADFTWFPTAVFMEFMLPRVFGWPEVFREDTHFPRLAAWYKHCEQHDAFALTRKEIWDYWVLKEQEGQFESIKGELRDTAFKWAYP